MSSKVNDFLHELIQSLTKSEKRYFKLLSSRHTIGEENNYILLFDFIEKQDLYDEEQLKSHFKGKVPMNIFAMESKTNKYTGTTLLKTRSKIELLEFLINLTNDILKISKIVLKIKSKSN